ncbi:MAG: hypothetical protein M1822_002443 [Bathelium mastoideum]|nr:MAG: hypothetical protein M1822_002443 [Bathelium mastoideum]
MTDSSPPTASPSSCAPYAPFPANSYDYLPSLAAGLIFTILFSLSLLLHLWKAVHYPRLWFLFLFVCGALGETLGWAGRLAAHWCSYGSTLFTFQFAVLILSPAFTQAAIYVVLWVLITILGRETSPVPPKTYLSACFAVDVICGTLQATGGGLAASAFDDGQSTQPGTTTMVVGIVFQLVSTCIFSLLLDWVAWKGRAQIRHDRYLTLLTGATFLAVGCMITRGVYRSIELIQGWQGKLITTQRYFIALDGAMMIIALAVFNICNPGELLMRFRKLEENVGIKVPLVRDVASDPEKSAESGNESESPERTIMK